MDPSDNPSPFGRSLLLEDGDLRFADGDLAPVAGRDNLLQGVRVMIDTPFGSDVFNANYGFDLLAILSSPQTTRMTKDLIRLNIVKSVSTDNRVREIKDVVFDDDPRYFELLGPAAGSPEEAARTRRLRRGWRVLVVLETLSEGEVAVRLEGVGPRS